MMPVSLAPYPPQPYLPQLSAGGSNQLCLQPIATRLQRKSAYILASINKTVVVTRERGKNGKLMKALEARGIYSLELPLIEHKLGTDFERLPLLLNENKFHWIAVTSPEAASVFLQGWKTAGHPKVKIAVVGSGTREVFEQAEQNGSLDVCFTPSKANAKCLAEELPRGPSNGETVLYPASIKASNEIESGLTVRGFNVTRLNTYSTVYSLFECALSG
ncbi:hypothetical protein O6H91_13G045400 [Diphasiastrum complanatum]|uniref:Uncharacterized protein n=1 Tax=Diphasiastrum complanatum TaxID=34168 RepID=A0ACC2BUA5_DIPCM|nr:hypothetical protein O6H91_13G045400 [Diphasiastrum complanatum]